MSLVMTCIQIFLYGCIFVFLFLRTLCFWFLFLKKNLRTSMYLNDLKSICASNHIESNSRCNLIFEFIVVFRHKKKKICFITEAQFVVFSFFSFFFGRIAISFRNISIKSEQYSAPIKSFQWPTNDSSTFCSFKGPQSVYIRRIRQSDIYLFNHEF